MPFAAWAAEPEANPFTEEAIQRGVTYEIAQYAGYGHGIAFTDLDNDGDSDLVLIGASDGTIGVFENDGTGHFIDRSATSGLPKRTFASGVIAADYNNDGLVDLFVSCSGQRNVLGRNTGNLTFVDEGIPAGVHDPTGAGEGCAWGDYDGDGWLDLLVVNRVGTNNAYGRDRLFRNLGDGTFEDVSDANGIGQDNALGFQGVFFDFDRDGDLDIYISNDFTACASIGWINRLHENVNGTFVDVTAGSGAGVCLNSMGVALGDFDNNGFPDLYPTNTPQGNPLLMNQGDGTFVDESAAANVGFYSVGWGAVFFDYNNDCRQDLYVCDMIGPNDLYVNVNDGWPLVDCAAQLGVDDAGQSFGVAAADIDGDGDSDLLVTNQRQGVPSNVRLFINHEGEHRAWMKIDVVGDGPNWEAIGASLDIRTGDTHQYREIYAGSNFKAQNERTILVGMDAADLADDVVVRWPGGETRTLANLSCYKRWTAYPNAMLGDADDDGAVDLDDFFAFAACYGQTLEPGCERMDFDGDGAVNNADFAEFINRYVDPLDDCDGDRVIDLEQILADASLDLDQDGALDNCDSAPMTADFNGDGVVDGADLAALLAAWGGSGEADLNGDGVVDGADLASLLAQWSSAA